MPAASDLRVLLIPGADGRGFEEDLAAAAARGVPARVVELPAGPSHVIDPAHFDLVADRIEGELAALRAEDATLRVAAIGRNRGGGHLAYCAARGARLDALVLTGAVPQMSVFLAESAHPSAAAIRALDTAPPPTSLVPLDIVETLPKASGIPCLIQLGLRDPMLYEGAADGLEGRFRVDWFDDDHAMEGAQTIAARWEFLVRTPTGPRELDEPTRRSHGRKAVPKSDER